MAKEGGLAELYAGFIPIIAKQIPYAVGQFTAFEWMTTLVYAQMGDARANISKMQQTGVTLGCGIVAGLVAAVLSNPADVLLSKINKEKRSPGASVANRLKTLAVESGPRGLFIGLGPRLVMTSFLVAGQFLMYSGIKDSLGARKGIEISH
jgi:solute carrier family 25 phosphate transporter 3